MVKESEKSISVSNESDEEWCRKDLPINYPITETSGFTSHTYSWLRCLIPPIRFPALVRFTAPLSLLHNLMCIPNIYFPPFFEAIIPLASSLYVPIVRPSIDVKFWPVNNEFAMLGISVCIHLLVYTIFGVCHRASMALRQRTYYTLPRSRHKNIGQAVRTNNSETATEN